MKIPYSLTRSRILFSLYYFCKLPCASLRLLKWAIVRPRGAYRREENYRFRAFYFIPLAVFIDAIILALIEPHLFLSIL